MSKHKNIIVSNDNVISFDDCETIIDKKNKILKYNGPCNQINVQDYKDLIKINDKYTLTFITNKRIDLKREEQILQIIPYCENNYEIVFSNYGKIKKIEKIEIKEITSDKIKILVKSSDELNDRINYIICIVILFLSWFFIQLYGHFNIIKPIYFFK
jgi:hypothetical protein